MTAQDRLLIVESFKSAQCRCGKKKVPKKSHCLTCYRALPGRLKSTLWRLFGEGYEEAYQNSCDYLDRHGRPAHCHTNNPPLDDQPTLL